MPLDDAQRRFAEVGRVGHLATAEAEGAPHVVPVCYALAGTNLYITIDDKPKQVPGRGLKRLRNIVENDAVAFVVDRYDDADWSRLGWLMLRGRADILEAGAEHDEAQRLLRARYRQLNDMDIARHPVIALRIERASSWGKLDPD